MPIRFRRQIVHIAATCMGVATCVGVVLSLSPTAFAATTPPSIAAASLNVGEVGVAYSQRLLAVGGTAPYVWSTTSSLPTGLSLSADGQLSGIPEAPIDEQFAVTVTDALGSASSTSIALEIVGAISIATTAVPDPVLGQAYTAQLSASGGAAPYTWSVTSGPIPLGLVFNSDGVLSGLPALAGQTVTTVTVSDVAGGRASAPIPLTVDPSADVPESYLVTSGTGAVSTFAGPGVHVPQTGDDGPSGVVGIATDATDNGYWLVTSTGQVIPSPRNRSYGSVGRKHLSGHIVGIAAKTDGAGYWLASSTGHVYGFGSARSFGSVKTNTLSGYIVGIAAKTDGAGYWLASSTGHVYGFGGAQALRVRARARPTARVVGIASDPASSGYWVTTSAGRVYAYGRAAIEGSIAASRHLRSVIGIAGAPLGAGYWLISRSGAVFAFGSALPLPSVEVAPGANRIVGIASPS